MTEMFMNKSFRFLQTNNNRFVILKGGAGSSKSYSMAQHIFLNVVNPNKNDNWLVLRKVANTIKESVFALLKEIIIDNGAKDYFHINKSDKSFECLTGNKIITMGLDDPEKIKSVHGATKIWMEEASEFSKPDFIQLNLRLRGMGDKKQYYLTFNPIDIEHWIKEYFFDNLKDDCFIHHSTYKDNAFLDPEYIKELKRLENIDYYYYTVYCLGEWGHISTARVFHNITSMEFEIAKLNLKNSCHGMDFGFIHASTLMSQGFKEKKLYIYDEQYYKELTNTEFIKQVNESKFNKDNIVIADSAEPDRIKEFKQDGFKISGSKKGKGSLKDGIDFLKNYEIIIHSKNCPNALREFQGYKYRELKDGTVTPDYVELDDDTIAGVRYGTEHLWSKRTMHQKAGSISKAQIFAR